MTSNTSFLRFCEALSAHSLLSPRIKASLVSKAQTLNDAASLLKLGKLPERLEKLLAQSATYSYFYAKDVLRGPFPLGESVIAQNAGCSYFYAKDVLHGPFPLGEPTMQNGGYKGDYENFLAKHKEQRQ